MKSSFMKDTLFWILLFGALIVILGIHLSRDTPIQPYYPESAIIQEAQLNPNSINDRNIEYFENQGEKFKNQSNSMDIEGGASTYYQWGLPDRKTDIEIPLPHFDYEQDNDKDHPVISDCIDCDKKKCCKKKEDECVEEEPSQMEICKTCDITVNKDIDKYVLKSSVPPCPDMSEYAKKNQMHPDMDMKDWIRKSDIEACPKVDMNEFIRKSEIPACPAPVKCPECPICPKPQPPPKCKQIKEFKIVEHPDFKNFIHKNDVQKMIDQAVQKQCNISSSQSSQSSNSKHWYSSVSDKIKGTKPQTPDDGLYVGDSVYARV
jgi:hypothetical protein